MIVSLGENTGATKSEDDSIAVKADEDIRSANSGSAVATVEKSEAS